MNTNKEKRTEPFTVKEIHELAERHRDEWMSARVAAYKADPVGTYPMHKFVHASDMFYHPGPPSIPIHYYTINGLRNDR